MSKLDKQLNLLYIATLLVALLTYIYFEFISPLTKVPLAGINAFEDIKYISEVVADLVAIGFVYLSLRMMVMPRVKKSLSLNPLRYTFWTKLRWAMLTLVIFLGLGVHYLFSSPSTIGCPIIGALAMIFVWPTQHRRHTETNVNRPSI